MTQYDVDAVFIIFYIPYKFQQTFKNSNFIKMTTTGFKRTTA